MAGLTIDKNGTAAVYVKLRDGRRKPVRLGRLARRKAETIRGHVAELEAAAVNGLTPAAEARRWRDATTGTLRSRLVAVGLAEPEDDATPATLGAFAEAWLTWKAATVKTSTMTRAKQARRLLVERFGADRLLARITPGDADDWRAWLLGTREAGTLAEATVRRRTADARELFAYASRKGVHPGLNPFEHLPTGDVVDHRRQFHLPADDAARVLAELEGRGGLTTGELRLAFVLARWGGLRVQSEAPTLTWADIDWAGGVFTVQCPKTAHLPGHETRTVPLFPEVAAELTAALHRAEPGAVYVLPWLRGHTFQAFRTPLVQAVRRAGLEPWPKLWHNLRATRQTELTNAHPEHVVCGWLGNSGKVARAHYLHTTDDHLARAVAGESEAHRAVRNPVRAVHAGGCTDHKKTPSRCVKGQGDAGRTPRVARPGLEPGTPAFSMPRGRERLPHGRAGRNAAGYQRGRPGGRPRCQMG